MATETKVIIDMDQKGIEITCKHCGESQTYTMRSKEIPTRPKTQCQNCEKWIYIDKSLLVKKFGQKDLVKKDQKKESLYITNQEDRAKSAPKTKEKTSIKLTKQQRPKNNDQKIIRSVGNIHTPERNKERLYDIYFKTDTIENLAKKYEIPRDYLNKIKSKLKKLKYPPRIEDNKLVCYQCGKENEKRLVFHHNHKTNEYIALVCDSCNQKLENNEGIIYPLQDNTKKVEKSESKNSIKENRGHREVISIEQMSQEVELFGRTIPLDKVREIARETLLGHRVMMEGVKSWLGVWKKRYHEYIEDKPEHFLIDKYEKAQETLEFLYKVEKLFKEITNGKS